MGRRREHEVGLDARAVVGSVLLAGVLVGCGGGGGDDVDAVVEPGGEETTTAAPTTTTAPHPLVEDLPLIRAHWRAYSDAWARPDSGLAFLVAHNYPGVDANPTPEAYDACMTSDGAYPYTLWSEEAILDPDTVEPDPTWAMPDGPLGGVVLEGRTYIMTVNFNIQTDMDFPPRSGLAEVHVTVRDGQVFHFIPCFPAEGRNRVAARGDGGVRAMPRRSYSPKRRRCRPG
jgi:hypothetical protein